MKRTRLKGELLAVYNPSMPLVKELTNNAKHTAKNVDQQTSSIGMSAAHRYSDPRTALCGGGKMFTAWARMRDQRRRERIRKKIDGSRNIKRERVEERSIGKSILKTACTRLCC